mmetsp:Transcript_32856/g.36782  ORF Transcript_32856/g.36782 Transcript_32856/m.36782 type:complete len:84 (+) Transcript_32856:113-364(+)|eukprot:CAMPEP_0170884272 /NCGR_PEP_ID=MMETSP0734-20130129/34882_1 /TAXON_ID=186038 /ORGANISM="Fragilariopsis kerguelensis, Strain L26-C5" /LENGTH=83 /DNA_ID=CAMNT_0011268855 /DNA_START=791 /DNA_END=1042 /DNA_ORIENTATION=-
MTTLTTPIRISTDGGEYWPVGQMECDHLPSPNDQDYYSDQECYLVKAALCSGMSSDDSVCRDPENSDFVDIVDQAKRDGSLQQ